MWIARLRALPRGWGATLGHGIVESTNYDYAVQALLGLLLSVRDEEENLADAALSDSRRLRVVRSPPAAFAENARNLHRALGAKRSQSASILGTRAVLARRFYPHIYRTQLMTSTAHKVARRTFITTNNRLQSFFKRMEMHAARGEGAAMEVEPEAPRTSLDALAGVALTRRPARGSAAPARLPASLCLAGDSTPPRPPQEPIPPPAPLRILSHPPPPHSREPTVSPSEGALVRPTPVRFHPPAVRSQLFPAPQGGMGLPSIPDNHAHSLVSDAWNSLVCGALQLLRKGDHHCRQPLIHTPTRAQSPTASAICSAAADAPRKPPPSIPPSPPSLSPRTSRGPSPPAEWEDAASLTEPAPPVAAPENAQYAYAVPDSPVEPMASLPSTPPSPCSLGTPPPIDVEAAGGGTAGGGANPSLPSPSYSPPMSEEGEEGEEEWPLSEEEESEEAWSWPGNGQGYRGSLPSVCSACAEFTQGCTRCLAIQRFPPYWPPSPPPHHSTMESPALAEGYAPPRLLYDVQNDTMPWRSVVLNPIPDEFQMLVGGAVPDLKYHLYRLCHQRFGFGWSYYQPPDLPREVAWQCKLGGPPMLPTIVVYDDPERIRPASQPASRPLTPVHPSAPRLTHPVGFEYQVPQTDEQLQARAPRLFRKCSVCNCIALIGNAYAPTTSWNANDARGHLSWHPPLVGTPRDDIGLGPHGPDGCSESICRDCSTSRRLPPHLPPFLFPPPSSPPDPALPEFCSCPHPHPVPDFRGTKFVCASRAAQLRAVEEVIEHNNGHGRYRRSSDVYVRALRCRHCQGCIIIDETNLSEELALAEAVAARLWIGKNMHFDVALCLGPPAEDKFAALMEENALLRLPHDILMPPLSTVEITLRLPANVDDSRWIYVSQLLPSTPLFSTEHPGIPPGVPVDVVRSSYSPLDYRAERAVRSIYIQSGLHRRKSAQHSVHSAPGRVVTVVLYSRHRTEVVLPANMAIALASSADDMGMAFVPEPSTAYTWAMEAELTRSGRVTSRPEHEATQYIYNEAALVVQTAYRRHVGVTSSQRQSRRRFRRAAPCAVCRAWTRRRCTRCQEERYCSDECQSRDAYAHFSRSSYTCGAYMPEGGHGSVDTWANTYGLMTGADHRTSATNCYIAALTIQRMARTRYAVSVDNRRALRNESIIGLAFAYLHHNPPVAKDPPRTQGCQPPLLRHKEEARRTLEAARARRYAITLITPAERCWAIYHERADVHGPGSTFGEKIFNGPFMRCAIRTAPDFRPVRLVAGKFIERTTPAVAAQCEPTVSQRSAAATVGVLDLGRRISPDGMRMRQTLDVLLFQQRSEGAGPDLTGYCCRIDVEQQPNGENTISNLVFPPPDLCSPVSRVRSMDLNSETSSDDEDLPAFVSVQHVTAAPPDVEPPPSPPPLPTPADPPSPPSTPVHPYHLDDEAPSDMAISSSNPCYDEPWHVADTGAGSSLIGSRLLSRLPADAAVSSDDDDYDCARPPAPGCESEVPSPPASPPASRAGSPLPDFDECLDRSCSPPPGDPPPAPAWSTVEHAEADCAPGDGSRRGAAVPASLSVGESPAGDAVEFKLGGSAENVEDTEFKDDWVAPDLTISSSNSDGGCQPEREPQTWVMPDCGSAGENQSRISRCETDSGENQSRISRCETDSGENQSRISRCETDSGENQSRISRCETDSGENQSRISRCETDSGENQSRISRCETDSGENQSRISRCRDSISGDESVENQSLRDCIPGETSVENQSLRD